MKRLISIIVLIFLFGCLHEDSNKDEVIDISIDELDAKYRKRYSEEYDICINDSLWGGEWQCIAWVTDDLELCNKWLELYSDLEEKNWCLDEYYIKKKSLEIDSCDKIMNQDVKIACKAFKLGKSEECGKIHDKLIENTCKAIILEDKEICKSEECRAFFEEFYIYKNKDFEKCVMIEDSILCEAVLSSDKEVCIDSDKKDNCYRKSMRMVVKEMDLEKRNLGILELDLKYCDDIDDIYIKDECINNISYEIYKRDKKDREYLDKGGNEKDMKYCEIIENNDIKKSCVSIVENDIEMCKEVGNELDKFFCIIQIAEIEGNTEYCDLLNERKQECYDYFGEFF